MSTAQCPEILYGLVDGAQYPEALAPWVLEFSPETRSLFEGLPEDEAGNAAPILFEIDDVDSEWVRQIDDMDRYRPCLTVMRSALRIDELKVHLQRFLFADIGDGMQVLLRLFDPRSLGSILDVCGQEVKAALTLPIETWIYRGGYSEWQNVEIGARRGNSDPESTAISLSAQQLDELERCDEPYTLMSELDFIDEAQPYATRYQDFMRRYVEAVKWRLAQRADRQTFCVASYQYGERFDEHEAIQFAIRASVAHGTPLLDEFQQVPAYVWQRLKGEFERRANVLGNGGAEE